MKKVLCGLLVITFCIVSFIAIKQYGYSQFQLFNNDEHKLEVLIGEGNKGLSKQENFILINKIAKQSSVNLERVSYELSNSGNQVIVYYSSLGNPDSYFKNINLKSGVYLTGDSNKEAYLSTNKVGNSEQIGQIELFYSADQIEIRPFIAGARLKDIKGLYHIEDDDKVAEFEELARENGFELTISEKTGLSGIQGYEYNDLFNNVLIVLCLLILLAMLYDVSESYKTISIRYMLGESFFSIGIYLFRRYSALLFLSFVLSFIGLIVFLFFYNQWQQLINFLAFWAKEMLPIVYSFFMFIILTWLSTLTINIATMVKNKKPVKLMFGLNLFIRLILCVFLVLGLQSGIYSLIELQAVSKQEENWSLLKEYNYLGTNPQVELFTLFEDETRHRDFNQLYGELIDAGSFYVFPSPYYNGDTSIQNEDKQDSWEMDNLVLEINENYLAVNPIYKSNGETVGNLSSGVKEINVLIPEKLAMDEQAIVASIADEYKYSFNLEEESSINIQVTFVHDNQTYFSFTPYIASDTNYLIEDPIVIVINERFDPLLLFSYTSMGFGGFYNKNSSNTEPFEHVTNLIGKYNFQNELEPLAVGYGLVELELAQGLEELKIITIYCAVFLMLTTILIYFTTTYYIEMNKQQLALHAIFGHSYLEKYGIVMLSLIVFWYISLMCTLAFSNGMLLIYIVLGLTCIDVVLMSLLLISKETKIAKNLLIIK